MSLSAMNFFLHSLFLYLVLVNGNVRDDFDNFISRYGRSYTTGSPEYNYRLSVFRVSPLLAMLVDLL